ncbi:hypothetical protein ACIQF6_35755 [Kitasatospora sp. NPDC092948]|uniref:hypothetical protein n=1 Tax=Kitasatospora sp. NPDC092948 TaxID=3364088 RepID=UPI003804B105
MTWYTPAPRALEHVTQLDLRGLFADGYTSEDVDEVMGAVGKATGLYVVCGWDYVDQWGAGGSSDFYAVSPDGRLHHLGGGLCALLNGDTDPSEIPDTPESWVGTDSGLTTSALHAVTPYNYAREQH